MSFLIILLTVLYRKKQQLLEIEETEVLWLLFHCIAFWVITEQTKALLSRRYT